MCSIADPHGSSGDKEIEAFAVSSRPFSHHTGMIYPALGKNITGGADRSDWRRNGVGAMLQTKQDITCVCP
jgi:hypothetical protein